jgi:uncharacterized protein (TIGR03435 family)
MHRRRFALLVAAATGIALAQQQAVFEVASVKISGPDSRRDSGGGPGTSSPGQYHYNSARLVDLIMVAYQVQRFQAVSKSDIERATFDVLAKVPAGATRDQFRTMMQNLLAERFHLKLHHETREFAGWEILVAKSGLKIKESQVSGEPGGLGPPQIGKDGFRSCLKGSRESPRGIPSLTALASDA